MLRLLRSAKQWPLWISVTGVSLACSNGADPRAVDREPAGASSPTTTSGNPPAAAPAEPGDGGPSALPSPPTGSAGNPNVPPGSIPPQGDVTSASEVLGEDAAEQWRLLTEELELVQDLDADSLLSEHSYQPLQSLSYDPAEAEFIDRIQESALALNGEELVKLADNGFVVSTNQAFPTFVRGYAAIYSEHLPVYISADAILEAVHSSYDSILMSVEQQALIPGMKQLLAEMHAALANPPIPVSEDVVADVDEYLAIARTLLDGSPVSPIAGGGAEVVQQLVAAALGADGLEAVTLFGVQREIDTSQFTPRGHYTESVDLERYFRAMMWLGRIDFRLIETLPDGSRMFHRDQYEATLLLRSLMTQNDVERWVAIDDAIGAFVGESDNLVLSEVDALVSELGGMSAALAGDDETVASTILAGGYGMQRIASHLMVNDGTVKTLPLNRSFLLLGQRYVLDSHVFSRVVYDRIKGRMMPDPLDVAFAALGNDQALQLLEPQLRQFPEYPGALARMRVLADAHDEEYWNQNLYNLWLSSLRALSPSKATQDPGAAGLPEIVGTEAWGRRMLNTQLASWAQLRHDTLLYAKQSYTGIPACDFPDAYVDPYPEFFSRLSRFAEKGKEVANQLEASLGVTSDAVVSYFSTLAAAAQVLTEMAEHQRTGTPFSDAHMEFINRAVRVEQQDVVCATVEVPDGWLADLYFDRDSSIEFDPTIADVHTQPADAAGNIIGHVLHVGTGFPRKMVITANTCSGPRAYVGVAFAYHEQVTTNFERLTDNAWAQQLQQEGAPDVPWMKELLAP